MKQDFNKVEELYAKFFLSGGGARYRDDFTSAANTFLETYEWDFPFQAKKIKKWLKISKERGWL